MIESEILDNPIPETKIDWDKPQKVISKTNGSVMITDGKHSTDYFRGTCIYTENTLCNYVGQHSSTWIKDVFIPFEKPILIK